MEAAILFLLFVLLCMTALHLTCLVVTGMKGKWGLFWLGLLLLGLFATLPGAMRLAKPNSRWARRRYRGANAHKLRAAMNRYEPYRAAPRAG
jgi:hypothetical protein